MQVPSAGHRKRPDSQDLGEQPISSVSSKQSLVPSHLQDAGIQYPLSQRKFPLPHSWPLTGSRQAAIASNSIHAAAAAPRSIAETAPGLAVPSPGGGRASQRAQAGYSAPEQESCSALPAGS